MSGLIERDVACPECGAKMHLYYLQHGPFYRCSRWPRCSGSHSAKANGEPLGIPANAETRAARILAHRALNKIELLIGRSPAYKWLATVLHIPREECHIALFDRVMCQKVIGAVDSYGFTKKKLKRWRRRGK